MFDVILVQITFSVDVISIFVQIKGNDWGIAKLKKTLPTFSTVDEHCTAPKLTLISFTIEYHAMKWFILGWGFLYWLHA